MLKGKKAGERGVQVGILVRIMNVQTIVNGPQVEADCCKEEVRNLL